MKFQLNQNKGKEKREFVWCVPYAEQNDTIKMSAQHFQSIWEKGCRITYPQEDYVVNSINHMGMIPIIVQ
jgi:hypothetical protein